MPTQIVFFRKLHSGGCVPLQAEWDSNLKSLDYAGLPMLFEGVSAASRNAAIGLKDPQRFARKIEQRRLLNLTKAANAARAIGQLPAPGVDLHIVTSGTFSLGDTIPAILDLAGTNATNLHVATMYPQGTSAGIRPSRCSVCANSR